MGKTLQRTAAFTALWKRLRAGSAEGPSLGQRIGALPRMIKATAKGEYDGGGRLTLMLAAGAYVAWPIDLVPEAALLLFGLIDDALVVTWLAGAVLDETGRFLAWEERQRATIAGEVVG